MKIKKFKKNTFNNKNIILFFIAVLSVLILLNSINNYIIWDDFETTQSAIDRFSIGHIIFGLLICITALIILVGFKFKFGAYMIIIALSITLFIGVMWEVLENSEVYVNSIFKFNNLRDSQLNMITDVFLNMLGASLVCLAFWYIIIKKNKK